MIFLSAGKFIKYCRPVVHVQRMGPMQAKLRDWMMRGATYGG